MVKRSTDGVKPLSAVDVERWGVDVLFLVWLVARSAEDLIDGAVEPAGLSADEYAVFSMLRATGGTTPTELARWMAAPPTTVSAYVKRFTAQGLVTRVPNPDDGRSALLRLTPAGIGTHDAARRRFAPVRSAVIERLAGDHPAVADALMTLHTVVDGLRAPPSREQVDTPPSDGAHRS